MITPVESRLEANGLGHHVITWDGRGTGAGSGATVVLCHGFLDLAWSFDPLARRLAAAGLRAVAFDWRGHGESDWIGAGGYYHFPDYILDLERLVPQIADGPVHLVGHSMGGTASAMYAGTRPARIATLTLVEGIGPPSHPLDLTPDRFGAWFRTLDKHRAREHRPLDGVDEALGRMRIANPDLPEPLGRFLAEKATRALDDASGRVTWTFDPLHRTTAPLPFRPEIFAAFTRRVTAPTLAVFGTRGLRLPDEAERLATFADHREIEVEAGHMIHWTAPDALSAAILAHVERT